MRVIYTILIMSLLIAACNSNTEQQDTSTPSSVAAPTSSKTAPKPKKEVVVPETSTDAVKAIQDGKNVSIKDDVKKSILSGKWAVVTWGSEELKNSMKEAYTSYASKEATKTYEFDNNRNVTVRQGTEVIDQGSWSMGGTGQDIKISLRDKRFLATINFNSSEEMSFTWQENNANITMVLKKN